MSKRKPGFIDASPTLPLLRTSERRTFKRCQVKWEWEWLEALRKPTPPSDALWFGIGWHEVMAHLYGKTGTARGRTPLKVWRDYCRDEIRYMRTLSLSGEWSEEPYADAQAMGEDMIGSYLDHWREDDKAIHMLTVEESFEVVIGGVLYCLTIDGAFRDERENGAAWIFEHKTTKGGQTAHLPLDDQGGSYWAVGTTVLRDRGLIGPKEAVKGIRYNFSRKSLTDERPRNPDGLYTNKPVKADYLSQLPARRLAALGAKPTMDQLAEAATAADVVVYGEVSKLQPKPRFFREDVYRTARERTRQIDRIKDEAAQMALIRSGDLNATKNPTKDCSWDCPFYGDLCQTHEQGQDLTDVKTMLYTAKYDPYEAHRRNRKAA